MAKKKIFFLLFLVFVILLATAALYYAFFIRSKSEKAPAASPQAPARGLGSEIYQQVQNPGEKIPETNPFDAKTNPFGEAKTNPFKDTYTNPFEK
ncbi:MAG: hypothetical protein HYW95_01595 [Candidatus Wildermuthbacteria bacterium]|nr:hypothetical protein [Candidatus Wildermuthbacteria bacterium]